MTWLGVSPRNQPVPRLRLAPMISVTVLMAIGCGDAPREGGGTVERRGRTAAVSSWPVFRGDATLTGVARTQLADDLTLAWTFPAGSDIEATAAIVLTQTTKPL